MTIATAVLEWSGADDNGGLTDAELNAPFKVEVLPSQPAAEQNLQVRVYAQDYFAWSLDHKGPSGGTIQNTLHREGISYEEMITINGGNSVNASYPVDRVLSATTGSGLIREDDFSYEVTPGQSLTSGAGIAALIGAQYGSIVLRDPHETGWTAAGVYGAIDVSYQTTRYKQFNLSGLTEGTHFFMAHRPGTPRRQVVALTIAAGSVGAAFVTVEVRDYCTDQPIPGASVQIDGQTYLADENGIATIGQLDSGGYNPVISAAGYTASADDTLDNDYFEV